MICQMLHDKKRNCRTRKSSPHGKNFSESAVKHVTVPANPKPEFRLDVNVLINIVRLIVTLVDVLLRR